jgi:hypothetical protein
MSKVYLINIGANTSDRSRARCPVFANGSWIYVPFSYEEKGTNGYRAYPKVARPYIRNMDGRNTHCDPDWTGLTYGDNCDNPRGRALRRVVEDDILLFWALLWPNTGNSWADFTGEQRWCFVGALRVREILRPGQRPEDAKSSRVARAKQNVHFYRGQLDTGNYVFIGCTKHSGRFTKAVDLQVTNRAGLLYRTIHTASGGRLSLNGTPRWNTSLRASRAVWDLDIPKDRARAKIARDAILRQTGYDLLRDL